jgi:hypothetical protein
MKTIFNILLAVPVLCLLGCRTPPASVPGYSGKVESVQISTPVDVLAETYPIALGFHISTPEYKGPVASIHTTLSIGGSRRIELGYPDERETAPFPNEENNWLACQLSLSRTNSRLRVWTKTVIKEGAATQPPAIKIFLQNDEGKMVEQTSRP